MPYTANRLLDLDAGVGEVRCAVRWEVLDSTLTVIGEVTPYAQRLSIRNDPQSRIPRTLRGFQLRADDANDINLYRDRLRPTWVYEDGTHWPAGVFVFHDPERHLTTWESPLTAPLRDQWAILDQQVPASFGVPRAGKVAAALRQVVTAAGFAEPVIADTDVAVLDPIVWPAGTQRRRIIDDLCQLAGFARPYFDNRGILVAAPLPPLEDGPATMPYDTGPRDGGLNTPRTRVYENSAVQGAAPDLPGAHLVINSGGTTGDISAIAYVDARWPWSPERRGHLVLETHRIQGIESTAAAQRIADELAAAAPQQAMSFDSPPDPRHDTYDVVRFGSAGDLYREVSWRCDLEPGGVHTHILTRPRPTTEDDDGAR